MNLHLHIDRVVIDGPLDLDRAQLEAAITEALAARLDRGVPEAAHEASRRGADVVLPTGRPADAIAQAVATVVVPGAGR